MRDDHLLDDSVKVLKSEESEEVINNKMVEESMKEKMCILDVGTEKTDETIKRRQKPKAVQQYEEMVRGGCSYTLN